MLKIKANAKINLFLEVTGRLENGYHTLRMIMQSVDLCDTLTIEKAENIELYCPEVAIETQKNIAYKAAKVFFERSNIIGGAKISIEKRIPQQAGMGGGSADAAAVLVGLNRLYGEPLTLEELLLAGAALGADVPFSIVGGCMRAEGIGERLSPIANNTNPYYLIAKPQEGCSTPSVFAEFDRSPNAPAPEAFYNAVSALRAGDLTAYARHCYNCLTSPAALLIPSIAPLLNDLKAQEGCIKSFMTGSGSACIGIFEDEAAALRARSAIGAAHPDLFLFIAANAESGLITE